MRKLNFVELNLSSAVLLREASVVARRRTVLGYGVGAVALWALGPFSSLAAQEAAGSAPAGWRTWLLESASALRPAAPGPASRAEVRELLRVQAERTTTMDEAVARWGSGPAVLPWTDLALELVVAARPTPVRAGRALALLHVAMYDAVVAARDAQAALTRRPPSQAQPRRRTLLDAEPRISSFPSEHAAVAAAASTVLAYLFPDELTERVQVLAAEAAESRVWAGTNYRSDVEAGIELGRAVGERAVARGQADGSAVAWDGTGRLSGVGTWEPTPPAYAAQPLDPLAGTWQTWVVEDVQGLRPAPPPPYGSPAWQAGLTAVRQAVAQRTPRQEDAVRFWAGGAGTVTPAGLWVQIARDLIVRDGLELPDAARVLALTSVAMADGFVCCWDAKYTYWTVRPISADLGLNVLIPTPPFPSYTSGHSTISAAAATVLGHLFPEDAASLSAMADEARDSRLWAGIHFPFDNTVGAEQGANIGRMVVDLAHEDGAG